MSDEAVQVWLVERSYGADEDLVTLVYATPDGDRHVTHQFSQVLLRKKEITAAETVPDDRLEPVRDPETRDRYAAAASSLAADHDPDDPV